MPIAELTSFHTFTVRDYTCPPPPPGEIQVRVEAIGICGSDLHNFTEGRIGDVQAEYPMVLGHEPVGTVAAVGSGVTSWQPGDRAALEPPIYCYHCEFCMSGRHHLCESVTFFSNPGVPGFFRDHINLPALNLLPLPANLSSAEGTLFEPLGIILHSFRIGDPKLGETAAVFGAGPIGLTTIAALRLCGISRIWAVEPVAHRRDLALALGADVAIDPDQADPVKEVLRDTAGRGVDMVFDCAAHGDSINQAIHMGASAARIVITGLPSEVKPAIDFHHFRRKEQHFLPVRRSNHKSEHALRILRENARLFAPMITHHNRLDEVQKAFETLESYSDGVGKVVLYP